MVVLLLLIYIVSNWTESQKNSRESKIRFISYKRPPGLTLQSQRVKNYWHSEGLWFHIHRILQTWLPLTTICFILLPIICAKKRSTTNTISKWTSTTYSAQSCNRSGLAGFHRFKEIFNRQKYPWSPSAFSQKMTFRIFLIYNFF